MRLHERTGLPEGVASANRRSIRVVGEDPLLVRALQRLLRNAGYLVGTSDDAPTFRATLTEPPGRDVALTIVDLPDDRSEEARSEGRDPWLAGGNGRVLWLSSSAVSLARASSYLAKPFSASQLLERVESLVPVGVGGAHDDNGGCAASRAPRTGYASKDAGESNRKVSGRDQ